MRRRDFIGILGGTLGFWVAQARAQKPSIKKRIAIIAPSRPVEEIKTAPFYRSFSDELTRRGFVEGENLIVDRYSGHGEMNTYGDLARAVVATSPDVIFTSGFSMTSQLQAATRTIPIVVTIGDPVASGLISTLARPGTNLTGVTVDAGQELIGKRLELLLALQPNASQVGYLSSSANWSRPNFAIVREMAQRAKVLLTHVDLGDTLNEAAYLVAFGAVQKAKINVLLVSDEPEHLANSKTLINLAANSRIPAIYPFRDLAVAGGLAAYYIDLSEALRYAAAQIAEILRGKNPAEIPFHQPTKFQLVINTKAAQRIGLNLPPMLLALADEVIE